MEAKGLSLEKGTACTESAYQPDKHNVLVGSRGGGGGGGEAVEWGTGEVWLVHIVEGVGEVSLERGSEI